MNIIHNFVKFNNLIINPTMEDVIPNIVNGSLNPEYLFNKNELSKLLQVSVNQLGGMTLDKMNERARTIQLISPDNIPLAKKILWAGNFYTELCTLFEKSTVDKYLNLVPFSEMYTYQSFSNRYEKITPPPVGEFASDKTEYYWDKTLIRQSSYKIETWKVPYANNYDSWLMIQCLLELNPKLKQFSIICYPRNTKVEDVVLYFNLEPTTTVSLYVPIQAVLTRDFDLVVKRVNEYWTSYGKLGGKAEAMAQKAFDAMNSQLVSEIKAAINSK